MADDDPAIPDTSTLLVALLRLASVINRPMRDGVAEPEGLSLNDLRILMALGGEGALAGHDLAEVMGMQAMSVSRALATLGTLGLVQIVDDPGSRRRKPHQLSAKGWVKHGAMKPEIAAVADFLFGALNARERTAFARIVAKLDARVGQWSSP